MPRHFKRLLHLCLALLLYIGPGTGFAADDEDTNIPDWFTQKGLLLQTQYPDGGRTEHIYLGRRQVAERSIRAEADTIVHIHTDTSGSPQVATDEGSNLLRKESYRAYGERRHNPLASQAQRQWFSTARSKTKTPACNRRSRMIHLPIGSLV